MGDSVTNCHSALSEQKATTAKAMVKSMGINASSPRNDRVALHCGVGDDTDAVKYSKGERVFHEKFGYGEITSVEGNKLTIDFDKAGEKRVIDSFVSRA